MQRRHPLPSRCFQVQVVDTRALGGYEDHLLAQIAARVAAGERTLVTCITKVMQCTYTNGHHQGNAMHIH